MKEKLMKAVFTGEFYHKYKELMQIPLKLFQNIEDKEHSPTHSRRPELLIYQSQTDTVVKKTTEQYALQQLMQKFSRKY